MRRMDLNNEQKYRIHSQKKLLVICFVFSQININTYFIGQSPL